MTETIEVVTMAGMTYGKLGETFAVISLYLFLLGIMATKGIIVGRTFR